MAAEIAIISVLSNNATITGLMGSPSGTAARIHMGFIPQQETLPVITVIRNSTTPVGDNKGFQSATDEERIVITIHSKDYVIANQISMAVRQAIDAIPAGQVTSFSIGGAADQINLKLDHIFFIDEQYLAELDGDNIKDIFEQTYTARVVRA